MSKIKRVLLLIAVAVVLASVLVPSLTATALVPYATYTYSVDGLMQTSPHAYDPTLVISSSTIEKGLKNNVNEMATLKYRKQSARLPMYVSIISVMYISLTAAQTA